MNVVGVQSVSTELGDLFFGLDRRSFLINIHGSRKQLPCLPVSHQVRSSLLLPCSHFSPTKACFRRALDRNSNPISQPPRSVGALISAELVAEEGAKYHTPLTVAHLSTAVMSCKSTFAQFSLSLQHPLFYPALPMQRMQSPPLNVPTPLYPFKYYPSRHANRVGFSRTISLRNAQQAPWPARELR